MKKLLLTFAAIATVIPSVAQPRLRPDNIDEVLGAMTLEEKVQLLVGGAVATFKDGVPTGTSPSSSSSQWWSFPSPATWTPS